MSFKLSVVALSAIAAVAVFAPSDARADYAFCSVASSSTRCDFQTYEQCQATMSGVGGDCIANPAGPSAASASAPARRSRRERR